MKLNKPVDVRLNTYFGFNKENTYKHPKLDADNHVRISKEKNTFPKCYILNQSEEVFEIKKVKNIEPQTFVTSDLNGKVILRMLYKKELQKQIKAFITENIIKNKDDKVIW